MIKSLKYLFSVCLLFTFMGAQAQFDVGATIGVQFPTGSFGDIAKTGFGFTVVGKYHLKENMAVGLNIGYYGFGVKDVGVSGYKATASMMPITALFEYQFGTGSVKPYVGADLGLYRFGVKETYQGESFSSAKTYFGLAPTGGILYGLSDKLSLCANLKYNVVFSEGEDTAWLGINVGLIFKIK